VLRAGGDDEVQAANDDLVRVGVDVDVVAVEEPVDHGRVQVVQEVQSLEDVAAPLLNDLHLGVLDLPQVSAKLLRMESTS